MVRSSLLPKGFLSLPWVGFPLQWLLLLGSTGSRPVGSVVVVHGLVAPWRVGSQCLDEGSNSCPLYWEASSILDVRMWKCEEITCMVPGLVSGGTRPSPVALDLCDYNVVSYQRAWRGLISVESFKKKKFNELTDWLLAGLGHCCSVDFPLVVGSGGHSLVVVLGLLVAEHSL